MAIPISIKEGMWDSIFRFPHVHHLLNNRPAVVEVKLKMRLKGKVMGQLVRFVVG